MKNTLLLTLFTALSHTLLAYSVTFRVDMSQQIGQFTTPEVNGSFNSWCGSCFPMTDVDGDNIWEATTDLAAGTFEYKFSADNWANQEILFAGSSCTLYNFGFINRTLTITNDIILPIVCWGSCNDCATAPTLFTVVFQVDMNNYSGFSTPEVNGTFNSWCGSCTPMSDIDGDNIWSVAVTLPEGSYQYNFSHDNWAGQESLLEGSPCTITNDIYTQRVLELNSDITLEPVCWGYCEPCANIGPYEVTFQVDMSEVSGFITPEVNGTFNGWCGGCFTLSDTDGDDIWTGTTSIDAGITEYKFAYDNWLGQESLTAGSPCTITTGGFTNRPLTIYSDTLLPVVCWNYCTSCDGLYGCSDINACNFNSEAAFNDGSCIYPGCTDINACNYTSIAGCDNGTCLYTATPCNDFNSNTVNDQIGANCTCVGQLLGCTDSNACNFNPQAQVDNNTCTYPGCTDFFACNYSPTAACSDNSCTYPGCNNSLACNYDVTAGCDDGSCLFTSAPCNDFNANTVNDQIGANCTCAGQLLGCTDSNACNFNPLAQVNNNTCVYPGCTDFFACNYSPTAACPDNSCTYPGCNNALACNYDVTAGCDDGSCLFTSAACNDFNANTIDDQIGADCVCEGQLLGCTNSGACNFNPQADVDNGACLFIGASCNDDNANTMLDQITSNCNCQGTPYNYGSMGNQSAINLCPGAVANTFSVSAPLNLASFAAQWYYREGNSGCPSGNSTAGWEMIAGANSLSFTPAEFTGTRTFACFITPSAIYGIPARWAAGCRTVTYYSFSAQAIIGNPNITPFSTVTYAVNPISGNTYNWNITNGAITSGQGTNVITVLWGQNGPYQVTLTEGNNTCNDTSTLLVVNGNCSLSVNAVSTDGASLCQGETATLEAITQTTGVNYQWYLNGNVIAGAINSSLEIYIGGNYQVLISQGACTAVSQTLVINTLSPTAAPQLVVDYLSAGCSGGSAIVSTVGGSFSTYAWNNGETSASIEVNQSGDYSVQLTDANGCQASAGPVSVNLSLQEALPICIVTVDPLTNKNIVVWEPQFSEVSASYTVYKEANVADEYVAIGNVSYGQDGIFEDVNSNAAVQANRYKLAVMDTCGVESSLSSLHKTIHLTSNVGLNGTVNLIWSHYEGFYFGSYNIYRGDSPGNLTLLSTIASNLNSYTDVNPPSGFFYYVIEVEGISCDPSRDVIVSRSNIVYVEPISIEEINDTIFSLYPNPASDELQLLVSSDALGNDVVITSTTGAIVVQQKITSEKMSLSLDACAAGFYILQVRDGNGVVATRRVVVE